MWGGAGVYTNFIYENGKLIARYLSNENESATAQKVYFRYDENGAPLSINYNGAEYFYVLNLQGDIIAILDGNGSSVVEYSYDSWGKLLATTGTMATTLGADNPLRYRGYYYDKETGLYYLQSRYYDPETGRFLNADNIVSGNFESVKGFNLYIYCFNNPINMIDLSGNWPEWATKLVAAIAVVAVVAAIAAITVATAGAGTAVAAIAVGAAKGAAIGFAVGAASGSAIGFITTGTLDGTLNGMADAALSGAICGAITGGINGYSNYSSAANFINSNGADSKSVFSSYKGTPKVKTLKADTTVYRTWGGNSAELGHWVSPKNYGASARNLLSLPASNTMTNTSSFLLKKGTTVLVGKAASLFGQSGGGIQWWVPILK